MNRSSSITRIYRVGDYQDIRITDEISDIPNELVLDEIFMSKLTELQLVDIEERAMKYFAMRNGLKDLEYAEIKVDLANKKENLLTYITKRTGE